MKSIQTIREEALSCAQSIVECKYFLDLWEQVKPSKNFEDMETVSEITEPFQDFWDILPDNPGIRVFPFFSICDLAEEYMFHDPD